MWLLFLYFVFHYCDKKYIIFHYLSFPSLFFFGQNTDIYNLRCKPDADIYNSLIHAHSRAGQWRWAINIMEDMLRAAVSIIP